MTLVIGEKFSSFKELQHRIAEFEKKNFVRLYITDSKTIKYAAAANPRIRMNANKALIYIYVVYSCAEGGRRVKAIGRPSFPQGCPMRLRFKLDDDGQYLVLHKGLEEHNHEVNSALYLQMSQNCRSYDSFRPRPRHGPRLKRGRKPMQTHYQKKSNGKRGVIVLKNLHGKMQNDFGRNDFHSVIYKLQQRNDATVEAVVNDYKVLQGLFFQDFAMKASFEAFPEILLIDSSHVISSLQMPYLYLFSIVDGNGEYEIVAVLLMANETQLLTEKMIAIFKDYNNRWNDILIIMTDKKLMEKNLFQKEFPNAPILLNMYGILQLFRHEVTCENMNLSKDQRESFLKIVQKLLYCCSDKQYNGIYEALLADGPSDLVDYYVSNWHPFRSEWIEGFKLIHPEFENETSNKLERMDENLTDICDKSGSFLMFFDKLFCMLSSLALEADFRASKVYEKQPTQISQPGSINEIYYNILTPYAFSLIKQQFALCEEVEISSHETTCKIMSCGKEIEVSTNTCDCSFVRSTGLPCKHIFAIRKKNKLPLYDDNLVPQRWTIQLYKDKHRVFKTLEQLEKNRIQMPGLNELVKSEQDKCCYKIAALVAHKLAMLASQAPGSAFDKRIMLMRQLVSAWETDRSVSLAIEAKEDPEAMSVKKIKQEPLSEIQ